MNKIEKSIVSALLHENAAWECLSECVKLGLSPEVFKDNTCRKAWELALKLEKEGIATIPTFEESLKKVIGFEKVLELLEVNGLSIQMLKHAKMLIATHMKSQWLVTAQKMSESWNHPLIKPEEIVSEICQHFYEMQKTLPSENYLEKACAEIEQEADAHEHGKTTRGVSTGIEAWDHALAGLLPANFIVIAGRPGGGKTALVEQIISNLLCRGDSVLYIQRELSPYRATLRLAAKILDVNFSQYETGYASVENWKKMKACMAKVKRLPLVLEPCKIAHHGNILPLILHHVQREKVKLIVFDYLQLIPTPKGMERRNAVAEVVFQLKEAANETGATILAVSQLNREQEYRSAKPRLSDLKECGDIEQTADVVLALWREEKEEGPKYPVTWSILKNRNGGTGDVRMLFDGPKMKFLGQIADPEPRQNVLYED